MENKPGSPVEIVETVKQKFSSSEEKRRNLRLEHAFAELSLGNIQVLKSDEFVQGLVDYLLRDPEEDREFKTKLLLSLGEGALSPDLNTRERALAVLSHAGENFLQHDDQGGVFLLVNCFCKWLEHETEILPGLAVLVKRMERLAAWLMARSSWQEGERVLTLFHQIHSHSLAKGVAVRSVISKTLERMATKATLGHLTNSYLLEDDSQQLLRKLLLVFEAKAAKYLLHRLIQSSKRKDRLMLINLLPAFGTRAVPFLEECLKKEPPWAIIRNVIAVLSEIRDDSCYPLIRKYFHHKDKRVQHEMIRYVVIIGGEAATHRLLEGLGAVNDDLKAYIVRLLADHGKREQTILDALCELAEARSGFSRSGNLLINTIIATLRTFPCKKSLDLLERLRTQYAHEPGNDQILLRIEEARKVIVPHLRHHQQRIDGMPEMVSFYNDPQQTQLALNRIAEIEEQLRTLISFGDMQGVGELLYDKACAAARDKDFEVAEKLRDRLLEINPLALNEVLELGELIEEHKTTLIPSHHVEIWSELYDEMTTEEFNALYYVLRQEDYRKGEIIVQAGETDASLYFINSGQIGLTCLSGGNESFLKRIGPGNILGSEQFFAPSVWTVTLRALTDVQIQVLDHAQLLTITKEFHGIEDTLQHYCRKFAKVPELLKMSGDERREYPRYSVTLYTRNVLLDHYGNKGKRIFRGELIDICRNGLAFTIKISSRNNAKLLLGRQIISEIQGAEGEIVTECSGLIVGVRPQNEIVSEFTVHIKLTKKIEDTAFNSIIALRNL